MIQKKQIAATMGVNPKTDTFEAIRPGLDGVHAMVPRDRMSTIARKRREYYAITPRHPFIMQVFGY